MLETVAETDSGLELVCSEVWGGNRFVETAVKLPGMRGWIYSQPCGGQRGGDVHYLSSCSAGLMTRICLADVAGHGEQVAQVSGWLHRLLRKHMNERDPQRILTALNRNATDAGFQAFTTAALASFYAPDGQLRYAYAGHPRALLFRAAEDRWSELRLDTDGSDGSSAPEQRLANLPLGVEQTAQFDVGRTALEPGDRLLLFSDGVLETPSRKGELFSDGRLLSVATEHRAETAEALGRAMIDALHAFAASPTPDHDDVTLIVLDVLRRCPGPKVLYLVRNQSRRLWRRLRG